MNRDDLAEKITFDRLLAAGWSNKHIARQREAGSRFWTFARDDTNRTFAALSQSGLALVPVVASKETASDLHDEPHTIAFYEQIIRSANLLPQPAILKGGDDGG